MSHNQPLGKGRGRGGRGNPVGANYRPNSSGQSGNHSSYPPRGEHFQSSATHQNRYDGPVGRSSSGHQDSIHQRMQQDNSSGHSKAPSDRNASSESGEVPVIVKNGDLFDMSEEYALAHCVGSDFLMSSGVAVKFRKKFRSVPELLDQNKNPGEVAFIRHESGQYVYYLVTKLTSTGKPTWESFEKSLIEWKELCVSHGVKKIAIPKIGCGRDQLDWDRVRNFLNQQFANTGIELTVCIIERENTPEKRWSPKLRHSEGPLAKLDPTDCALVFIASKDHFITPSIEKLAMKFGFTPDYTSHGKDMGDLYHFNRNNVNIFGLVAKKRHNDPISFSAIAQCMQKLRKVMKKSGLWYMGLEAFDDCKFNIVNQKLWTVIIDNFFVENIEVYFCWPEGISEQRWEERSR